RVQAADGIGQKVGQVGSESPGATSKDVSRRRVGLSCRQQRRPQCRRACASGFACQGTLGRRAAEVAVGRVDIWLKRVSVRSRKPKVAAELERVFSVSPTDVVRVFVKRVVHQVWNDHRAIQAHSHRAAVEYKFACGGPEDRAPTLRADEYRVLCRTAGSDASLSDKLTGIVADAAIGHVPRWNL